MSISAASTISSLRSSFMSRAACRVGMAEASCLMPSCGLAIRLAIGDPNCKGVVPNDSRAALMSRGFTFVELQKLMMRSISAFFVSQRS